MLIQATLVKFSRSQRKKKFMKQEEVLFCKKEFSRREMGQEVVMEWYIWSKYITNIYEMSNNNF